MSQIGIPICPDCGNNMCLLYPEIFAEKHLHGADKKYYESKKKDIDEFLSLKMEEHRQNIIK